MSQLQPMTVAEAAPILGETPRTVQRKAETGDYPATKLPGRTGAYLFDRAMIERIAAERASQSSEAVAS